MDEKASDTFLFDETVVMGGYDPMVDVHQQLLGPQRLAGSDRHVPCTSTVDVLLCALIDVYKMYDYYVLMDVIV